ncbi:hypothetical protein Q9189_006473 [Teloschistes chrysophthalmus]
MDQASLEYLVNHLVLPPKLPQSAEPDSTTAVAEKCLLDLVRSSLQAYRQQCPSESRKSWLEIQGMLLLWANTEPCEEMSAKLLAQTMSNMNPGDTLPIRVRAQNAGLIIRSTEQTTSLECFELSPQSEDVIKCHGSLKRTFPAHAVSIPREVATDPKFCNELFNFLSKVDREVVEDMMPKSTKAGSKWAEIRDTCHPGLVTELLMVKLAALGEPVEVPQIHKRSRDEVLWDRTLKPWRRSTFWTALKISIHTTLVRSMDAAKALVAYKDFMLYVFSQILHCAIGSYNDLCKVIEMKIARRANKLNDKMSSFVQAEVLYIVEKSTRWQSKIWRNIQETDARRQTHIALGGIEEDVSLTLFNCRSALDAALDASERAPQLEVPAPFTLDEWTTYGLEGLPKIAQHGTSTEKVYALADFERWTAQELPAWLETALRQPCATQCSAIATSAENYMTDAREVYQHCPRQKSTMLLTIGEWWCALDKLVCVLLPLLVDYPPEIPTDIFYPILLSRKSEMERLQELESYIMDRQRAIKLPSSIFMDPIHSDASCFTSKYYEQSTELQELLRKIEANARHEREEKKAEWERKNRQYESLTEEIGATDCKMIADHRGFERHYDKSCPRCSLVRRRGSINIEVSEWPIPAGKVQCRDALFHLRPPAVMSAWSNLTWMIVHDLGRLREVRGARSEGWLTGYAGLQSYCDGSSTSRLVLAATIKSVLASHYRQKTFPVTLETVYCDHGAQYSLYDRCREVWVGEQDQCVSFNAMCQTIIPRGPYENLQYAVDATDHTQNDVLASQTECDPDLSLHEYIAYGSVRADGEKSQWLNICRELRAFNLTWNTESVHSLIKQSAWQAGRPSTTCLRTAHSVFETTEFPTTLLMNISNVLDSIKANRQSYYTMLTLILLLLRGHSLASDNLLARKFLHLLRTCREVTFAWAGALMDQLRTTTNPGQITTVRQGLLRAALLCKMTFDVHTDSLQPIASSEDLYHWTTSSMIIYDNTPGAKSKLPADIQRMLLHDLKISHGFDPLIRRLVTDPSNTGLDDSVLQAWSSFRSSTTWMFCRHKEGRWVYKTTPSSLTYQSQTVYYNALSGELLVDGRPLGTLPKEYTSHSDFIRLFGAQILRVVASDMAGMLYMTAFEEHGYIIHFGFRNAALVIRARRHSTMLELISHTHFVGDVPTLLVEDYSHWLDLNDSTVEFRPMDRKWTADPKNWRLIFKQQSHSYLRSAEASLVDIRSPTCERVLDVLDGLETRAFMHITTSAVHRIHIALPRLGLNFFVNEDNEIECQELRKIVDQNQSVETLIGLRSRLVLCAQGKHSKHLDRIVLIPEGSVAMNRAGAHTSVQITLSGRDVRCLRYRYDPILNRLDGDGSVISRLYQAYLHALTSYILPDPLTGCLGMEESLKLLEEQVLRCCKPLEAIEIQLLNKIASLTPHRVFYPSHKQKMQQVSWHNNVSPLCQHHDFAVLAQKILTHSQEFRVFYHDLPPALSLERRGDLPLLQRAKVRNSSFLNVGYGGDEITSPHDEYYHARDSVTASQRVNRTYAIASLVLRWSEDMAIDSQLAARWKAWGLVSGFQTSFDCSQPVSRLLSLNLANSWGSLYELCRSASREESLFKVFFLFSQICYASTGPSLEDMKVLLAFATMQSLRRLPPFPAYTSFNLDNGSDLDESKLKSTIEKHILPFNPSRSRLSAAVFRQESARYNTKASEKVSGMVDFYKFQWPCRQPQYMAKSHGKVLDLKDIKQAVQDLFKEWYKNKECLEHIALVQHELVTKTTETMSFQYEAKPLQQEAPLRPQVQLPTSTQLIFSRIPGPPDLPPQLPEKIHKNSQTSSTDLHSLVARLEPMSSKQHNYKADLLTSLDAFHHHMEATLPDGISAFTRERTLVYQDQCRKHYSRNLDSLFTRLMPIIPSHALLKSTGLWPRFCIRDLLKLISSISSSRISAKWRDSLVSIGTCITSLQRARRLVVALETQDTPSFYKEIENPGQLEWNARERPDWLLIEIENDFLIRPVQVRVALEMIQPSNPANTLMQLNMGEGKSSVIIPLIASALADCTQLVRVVVLRSLTRQMQETLIQRLSGLPGRPVYFMPFSRKTTVNEPMMQQMHEMYSKCMADGGVVITQPEHMLSFKLIGCERFASGHRAVGTRLLDSQAWLDRNCRDVLDESDEILDVKFQLIYTLGAQRSMDGQPDRWLIMQSVFDAVENQAALLQPLYPTNLEVDKPTKASFPTIRMLSGEVRRLMISRVCQDILDSKIPGLVMTNLPIDIQAAATSFISDPEVAMIDCKAIESYCAEDEAFLKKLLLVRGLIAGDILLHVLHGKRWLVNYGLHPTRCLCAVPYRAKGVPAATAEFGHPDVAIALTCLSYYYSGLTDDQLRTCLELLLKADGPTADYRTWTMADQSFPPHLSHWNAVNLEDQQQCKTELFPALRLNKKVADFFMQNVVFPKEGKEFDQKLSTSGWDIPAQPGSTKITTGFSGTNDNRFLLPSCISQQDLPELRHTSGKVLEFLARPENLSYSCARAQGGGQLSSERLLEFFMRIDGSIRVLIDVGAQILDLSNDQVVAKWLVHVPDAEGGIYFDVDDRPMVLTKGGKTEPLATSSYLNRMDRCVVYLDDVHTRGTDLKMPRTARAAVTLGPRLAKDRLVQACMRLRQLGHGQSLMFIAPPEVHEDIIKITQPQQSANITGLHVIEWALKQSCLQIARNQPLRVMQGLSYYRRLRSLTRLKSLIQSRDATEASDDIESAAEDLIEWEAQSLRDLYGPAVMRTDAPTLISTSRQQTEKPIQELLQLWDALDAQLSQSANVHEELEREVGHEVEQQAQIERPPKAVAETPKVDPELNNFIQTGTQQDFERFATLYYGIFRKLSSAALLKRQENASVPVRGSTDFIRTVELNKGNPSDEYLRPVHWILVPKKPRDNPPAQCALIISQFEVNQCLDAILARTSRVALISYEPRVTRSMPSLDSSSQQQYNNHPLPGAKEAWNALDPAVRAQVHLFAGQLYFSSFEEYRLVLKMLGGGSTMGGWSKGFLKEWVGVRRKGHGYLKTHVGEVVTGRVLGREVFQEVVDDEEGEYGGVGNVGSRMVVR